jgi:hypothetical protein
MHGTVYCSVLETCAFLENVNHSDDKCSNFDHSSFVAWAFGTFNLLKKAISLMYKVNKTFM